MTARYFEIRYGDRDSAVITAENRSEAIHILREDYFVSRDDIRSVREIEKRT